MSIWIVVIFVVLTIVGLVMVGIGLHEKTKHKDNPAGKPGKTYDILLYAGIALAVIGIIGLIWSMISYSKSKKAVAPPQMMGPPPGYGGPDMMGPPPGYGGPDMMGPPPGYGDYNIEMSTVSRGPAPSAPPAPAAPAMPSYLYPLPDGRFYNAMTGTLIPPSGSMGMMGSLGGACGNNNSLNLEEFMKAAKLLQELKSIING